MMIIDDDDQSQADFVLYYFIPAVHCIINHLKQQSLLSYLVKVMAELRTLCKLSCSLSCVLCENSGSSYHNRFRHTCHLVKWFE